MQLDNKTKNWVETWKKAAPALEKVWSKELIDFDYSKNYKQIDEMLQYACEHGSVRTTSGLIEQQRYFMEFTKKMGAAK
ncbi:hypothetical protein MHK_000149 [Candidatus Magnetomorum sp. HK-1]|nr:hypothetical protein MHK_000149 [Candidatus Magnetomorum sp. HK-1]